MSSLAGGMAQGLSDFPASLPLCNISAHFYIYQVTREPWLKNQSKGYLNGK